MAAVHRCSLLRLGLLLCGISSILGIQETENSAQKSRPLIREKRDEDPQYPDENYWSGEQDRWPTFDEMSKYSSKRKRPGKRGNYIQQSEEGDEQLHRREDLEGKVIYGTNRLGMGKRPGFYNTPVSEPILKRPSIEKSLYDLLSSKAHVPSERRDNDDLKDLYLAAELLKRHRVPRGLDDATDKLDSGDGKDDYHPPEKSVQGTNEVGPILS
ncbi:uncharacterized protein RCH25_004677 [Pelodytes ibericus]